jgi:hypothetical protein
MAKYNRAIFANEIGCQYNDSGIEMKMVLSMKTPNRIFRQFVEMHEPALPILPAVHITFGTNVSTIIEANKLHLTGANIMKRNLYIFLWKTSLQTQASCESHNSSPGGRGCLLHSKYE